jgi:thiazole/oxazole-forming peptide maturase SagC family component
MKKYKLKDGVIVNKHEDKIITLCIGNINKSEITFEIENKNSKIYELLEYKTIEASEEEAEYSDILQLYSFGFLDFINDDKIFSIITDRDDKNNSYDKLLLLDDLLSPEDKRTLFENFNPEKIQNIVENFNKKIDGIPTFILKNTNTLILKVINRLCIEANKSFIIGFADNSNVFVLSIDPKVTGCLECVLTRINAKFSGNISNDGQYESSYRELLLLDGFIENVLEQHLIYGFSQLYGNVLHFNMNTFEYNFNKNERTILCQCCSDRNKIIFDEQNMRSINIIKELYETL